MVIKLLAASHVRRLHERGPALLRRRAIHEGRVLVQELQHLRPLEAFRMKKIKGKL